MNFTEVLILAVRSVTPNNGIAIEPYSQRWKARLPRPSCTHWIAAGTSYSVGCMPIVTAESMLFAQEDRLADQGSLLNLKKYNCENVYLLVRDNKTMSAALEAKMPAVFSIVNSAYSTAWQEFMFFCTAWACHLLCTGPSTRRTIQKRVRSWASAPPLKIAVTAIRSVIRCQVLFFHKTKIPKKIICLYSRST